MHHHCGREICSRCPATRGWHGAKLVGIKLVLMRLTLLCPLLLLCLLIGTSESVYIFLQLGKELCFKEELPEHSLLRVTYSVAQGLSQKSQPDGISTKMPRMGRNGQPNLGNKPWKNVPMEEGDPVGVGLTVFAPSRTIVASAPDDRVSGKYV